MAASRKTEFELHEDLRHQRREWRVERVGWALMALLLIAALLGLLGYGPLSHTRARSDDGRLTVAYDRFQRSSALSRYEIEAAPSLVAGDRLRLQFDRHLIDALEIEAVEPQPESVSAGERRTTYEFAAEPGGQPQRIVIYYRPSTFGRLSGGVTAGGAALALDQLVYP